MLSGKNVAVLMATYNDWDSVLELLPKIDEQLVSIGATGRVVIVDDGSTQTDEREKIVKLSLNAIIKVEAVDLYRNHGNQKAVAIGVAYCANSDPGDYLVIMDSDQEDKPEYIPQLLKTCQQNDDTAIVFAERSKRSEGRLFSAFYKAYVSIYRVLTGIPISVGNFSAMPRDLAIRCANIAELWSHFPAAIMKARLPFCRIHSERGKRLHGKSKMNFINLILHALSGFSVHAEVVGTRVLVASLLGSLIIAGLVVLAVALKTFTGIPILGWTSQMVSLLLIMLFQLIITMAIMVFLVISVRMQVPMIPAHEYRKFIMRISSLYG